MRELTSIKKDSIRQMIPGISRALRIIPNVNSRREIHYQGIEIFMDINSLRETCHFHPEDAGWLLNQLYSHKDDVD